MNGNDQGPKLGMGTKLALAGIGLYFAFNMMSGGSPSPDPEGRIDYKSFDVKVQNGEIRNILERGNTVIGFTSDGNQLIADIPKNVVPYNDFYKYAETYKRKDPEPPGMFFQIFMSFGPILLLLGVMVYMMRRQMGGGGGGMGTFTHNRASREIPDVKFKDVAGADEAVAGMVRYVEFLKNPNKFGRLGARPPKGVLLVGPPGTGKTLLAKATAGEAGVPFFSLSGSDFDEMFVGVGSARTRDLFEKAKKEAPSIIFIDEIDAVGKKRGQTMGGSGEGDKTLNSLLVQMDGFGTNSGVLVMAATNRLADLDDALVRSGRFDRKVQIDLPDLAGREKILAVHIRLKKVPLASDISLRQIAIGTPQFSGADLENLVNKAAEVAEIRDADCVTFADFENGKDELMMGDKRPSLQMTEEDRRNTAYHEAGHALQVMMEPASDPIYKATIIPRGGALGYVIRLPENDSVSISRRKLHADLAVAMGGRVAEKIFCGGKDAETTGASGDFKMATQIATRMVTEWGMSDSDELGYRNYVDSEQSFSGRFNNISEDTKKLIDKEIKAILDKAYNRAYETQMAHQDKMHLLAQALLKYDVLDGKELRAVIDGKDIDEIRAAAESARKVTSSSGRPKPGNDNDGSGQSAELKRGNDLHGPK